MSHLKYYNLQKTPVQRVWIELKMKISFPKTQ